MGQALVRRECISATLAEDRAMDLGKSMKCASEIGRSAARAALRAYQLTLSSLIGSQCRHLPTCSAYMDGAIARHGLWAGGFMGLARLCRCQPFGTAGFDPVPRDLPAHSHWLRPWRYGRWRGPLPEFAEPDSLDGCGPKDCRETSNMVNEADRQAAARQP
jgi:putative membrane protein insertion efficiency factor